MATYTDQLVVYQSGSLKKIGDSETVEIYGIELTSSLTVPESGLTIGSTAVTSTAAELNVLDGATSSNNTTGKAAILGTNGNLTIAGDLTVNGATTTIESTTLTVDDKNIELGTVATPTDTTADGGGITLKGASDKTFNWIDATDSWTSSEHLDLANSKEFKIEGTSVLSATTLGAGVTSSSLTSVGTLTSLTVDNISIDGSTIGHTDDTDLLTLADGVVTVAGEVSVTTLDIGGTDITATAAELNVLDAGTAGSSVTLADGDSFIIGDASASNATSKALLSDLKTYMNASAAGSIAADDISVGDASVTLETSSGSVDIKDFGQGSTQLTILDTNSSDFTSGDIVALAQGASGGLVLADKDATSYPVGVSIENSLNSARSGSAANIDVVTLWGSKVTVNIASASPDVGVPVYLGDDGAGTVTAPTAGSIYRLGFTTEDNSGGSVTSAEVLWMPQFIADLG